MQQTRLATLPTSTVGAERVSGMWERNIEDSLRARDARVVTFVREHPGCQRWEIAIGLGLSENYLRRALPRLRARGDVAVRGVRAAMRYTVP